MAESWAPSLADVGRHVPSHTRSTDPADDGELGTFTPNTTPTDAQAADTIDAAVNTILAQVGPMPTSPPIAVQQCTAAARSAAEWQAAADIELQYPTRPGDVQVWDQLSQRAFEALTALHEVLIEFGAGDISEFPVWSMPLPVAWGDQEIF